MAANIRPGKRFAILARDGYRCRYCGAQPPDVALEVDHQTPRSRGGSNHPDNLITACDRCNNGKHDGRYRTIADADQHDTSVDVLLAYLMRGWDAHANDPASICYGWCPDDETLHLLLAGMGDPALVRDEIADLARRVNAGEFGDAETINYDKAMNAAREKHGIERRG